MSYKFNYFYEKVSMADVATTEPDRSVNYGTLVEAVSEGTAIIDETMYNSGVIVNPNGTARLYYFYKKQANRVVGATVE